MKVKGELKALTIAAKDGVEAAAKVKTLEAENKKMTDENAVLTKNFESERVRIFLHNTLNHKRNTARG